MSEKKNESEQPELRDVWEVDCAEKLDKIVDAFKNGDKDALSTVLASTLQYTMTKSILRARALRARIADLEARVRELENDNMRLTLKISEK